MSALAKLKEESLNYLRPRPQQELASVFIRNQPSCDSCQKLHWCQIKKTHRKHPLVTWTQKNLLRSFIRYYSLGPGPEPGVHFTTSVIHWEYLVCDIDIPNDAYDIRAPFDGV